MSTAVHSDKQHSAHIRRSASDRWAKIIAYLKGEKLLTASR